MRGRPESRDPRGGAVLLAVLGFLAVLFLLVVKFSEQAIDHLEEQAILASDGAIDEDTRLLLESGLAAGEASLPLFRDAHDGLFNAFQHGWGRPLETLEIVEPGLPTVTIEDLSRRIPLGQLDRDELRRAFEWLEISSGMASELADTLTDWTDEDDDALPQGGERLAYRNEPAPEGMRLKPPNEPVNSLEELAAIPVFREAFFEDSEEARERLRIFRNHFTLEDVAINVNAASPETLEIIEELARVSFPGSMTALGFEDEEPVPDEGWRPVTRELIGGEPPEWLATATQRIRIRAEARKGDRLVWREADYSVRGADADSPVRILTRSGMSPVASPTRGEEPPDNG